MLVMAIGMAMQRYAKVGFSDSGRKLSEAPAFIGIEDMVS